MRGNVFFFNAQCIFVQKSGGESRRLAVLIGLADGQCVHLPSLDEFIGAR